MSLVADRDTLTNRFADVWEAAYPAIEWFADNQPEERPDGTYVRLITDPSELVRKSMGNDPVVERTGRVIVQICVPAGTGSTEAMSLAEAAADIFHLWTSTNFSVRCQDSEIHITRPNTTDPYYNVAVSTFYRAR